MIPSNHLTLKSSSSKYDNCYGSLAIIPPAAASAAAVSTDGRNNENIVPEKSLWTGKSVLKRSAMAVVVVVFVTTFLASVSCFSHYKNATVPAETRAFTELTTEEQYAAWLSHIQHSDETREEEEEEHTTPTFLSVVHHETGRYVDALNNPLYEELKDAIFFDFVSATEQEEGNARKLRRGTSSSSRTDETQQNNKKYEQLILDKKEITFHESLTLSWSSSSSVNDDDIIALYCPADSTNPKDFRDAATIAQVKATSIKHKMESKTHSTHVDQHYMTNDFNHNIHHNGWSSWFIHSFSIVREETCQFRLWKRVIPRDNEEEEKSSYGNNDNNNYNDEGGGDGDEPEDSGSSSSPSSSSASSTSYLQLAALSDTLYIPNAKRIPTALHLALTGDATEMHVQFTTGESGIPIVEYGLTKTTTMMKATGTSTTYDASDLCQAPANLTEPGKFVLPGMIHTVKLTNLDPDSEYSYRVGVLVPSSSSSTDQNMQQQDNEEVTASSSSTNMVWSPTYTFRSALPSGSTTPFSYVVYGDQGCPIDGWNLGGQRTAQLARRELLDFGQDHDDFENGIDDDSDISHSSSSSSSTPPHPLPIRAVHHFGDLSYAQGAAHLWDDWLHMIQIFATRVPLMIAIGNHEYDHTSGGDNGKDPSGVTTSHGFMPSWGNYGDDSNGECGVPTSKRFVSPTNGNGIFWYSHDYGLVHTIVISSEHDLYENSRQYQWLEKDLQSINRTKTPWVILETHRPLYESEIFWDQTAVTIGMRYEIERLLYTYNVDVVLAGHYHSYLRTCDGLYKSQCNNGGPIHLTVGSAGAHLSNGTLYEQNWTDVFISDFGYGRITVWNATALLWQFVSAAVDGEGTVMDELWIKRDRS